MAGIKPSGNVLLLPYFDLGVKLEADVAWEELSKSVEGCRLSPAGSSQVYGAGDVL